jgi:hypothetical protein
LQLKILHLNLFTDENDNKYFASPSESRYLLPYRKNDKISEVNSKFEAHFPLFVVSLYCRFKELGTPVEVFILFLYTVLVYLTSELLTLYIDWSIFHLPLCLLSIVNQKSSIHYIRLLMCATKVVDLSHSFVHSLPMIIEALYSETIF